MQIGQITKEDYVQRATTAVDNFEASEANKLLREWKGQFGLNPTESQPDKQLDVLRKKLLFTAFSLLPDNLAEYILKECLLDFIESGQELLDPIEKIEYRIKVAGYGMYDQEREKMKNALRLNKEAIGKFLVSEWIERFEKTSKNSSESVFNTFLLNDGEVANLSKDKQLLLKRLLELYERWLYSEVFSVFDLAVITKKSSGKEFATVSSREGQVTTHLPLLQALSKYENLGNQLITNERIKIKSQPEPVRPSLLYWIKYYRDELGIGHHSTVDRGNFLFRSENGKRLTAPERERVNLVLKSVEENYPVDIDTERSEIIFPAFVEPVASRREPTPQPAPVPAPVSAPTSRPKPAFNFGQGGMMNGVVSVPKESPAPGNLSFTSKHVFPAEKPATPAPTVSSRPVAQVPRPTSQVSQPQSNPFRINPVSLGKVKDNE